MIKNCFTCRHRFKSLKPDSWGGYPWKCGANGDYRLGHGQDKPCPLGLWKAKKEARGETLAR
jgi:hypothetical protein